MTAALEMTEVDHEPDKQPKVQRTFRTLPEGAIPSAALTWTSPRTKSLALKVWRRAVFSAFGDQARCIRVAWVLSTLFHPKDGFAFPSDSHLANETGLPVNKVQEALTKLDRGGAIIRTHKLDDDKSQRRIFPSRCLIPPALGGGDTPRQPGGQNKNNNTPRRPVTQLDQARLSAEIAERRNRDRSDHEK